MSTPLELAQAPRWVCWRLEPDPKGGKPRKVPYDPKSGRRASSTNPETWTDMATAQAAHDDAPDSAASVCRRLDQHNW